MAGRSRRWGQVEPKDGPADGRRRRALAEMPGQFAEHGHPLAQRRQRQWASKAVEAPTRRRRRADFGKIGREAGAAASLIERFEQIKGVVVPARASLAL